MNRRQFLKAAGSSAIGAVVFAAGCGFPKSELKVQSPARMPEDLVTGVDNWYATLCRQCPAGCGVIVRVMEGRAKKIEGNPVYPVNLGKLCARGQAGLQLLYHPDRLRQPLRRDRATGAFHEISWDEALNILAARLQDLRSQPDGVVFATNPLRAHLQLLVERFLAFYSWPSQLGALHLTHEPLESAPLRQAVSSVLGDSNRGILPDYDIGRARYVLSFGANFLSTELTPVHYSVGYGEFRQSGPTGRGTLTQIEPHLSLTGANADRWIPINPGTEGALALSLAYVMVSEGLADRAAAEPLTGGRGASALSAFRPEQISVITGVSPETITAVAREFAARRPALAIGGGPAAAQANGTFNMRAILALNFLVGSVGVPGGVTLNTPPIAGLPDAYGGAPLRRWRDFIERLRTGQPRPVKLVIIRGINPVFSLPASLRFAEDVSPLSTASLRQATRPGDGQAPLVVSFVSTMDETAALADLVLPEHTYLEEWGDDIPDPGPGYQVVGLQQPVVAPVHDTRSFPDVLLALGQRLGAPSGLPAALTLPWNNFRDLLRKGAGQLQSLGRGSVLDKKFEVFWNKALAQGGWWDKTATYMDPAPKPLRLPEQPAPARFDGDIIRYPLHLIPFPSNSLGDGRCSHLPWLQATPDPITTVAWRTWVEIGRTLSREADLEEGDVVSVESSQGAVEALVYVNPALPPSIVAMPFGQGHTGSGQYAQGRGSNPFSVLASIEDEETGALAWAATKVRLVKTGRWEPIPKFEGAMFPEQVAGYEVIEVTR